MKTSSRTLAALALLGLVVGGAVYASGDHAPRASERDDEDDGEDTPITGPALEKATRAALAHVGEGRVTDTEVGDEEGYYEVEITLESGAQVDVHLDEDFHVLDVEADDEDED